MNKFTNNEYFLSYGLVRDPFPPRVVDRNIFLTPEINRRIKLIRQHIKESQKLLFVTSASGAGKSLLAQKLLVLKASDWRVSLTRAHENMDSELLAHSAIQQLLHEKNENASQSISLLHKYLEQSYREKILPVIVIDNADELPFETLQFVLQLADLRYNEALFRIVLFANESITENLTKPGLKELAEDMVDIIAMPYFSREQIPAYLSALFSSCGEGIKPSFSESEYDYLHKASGGLPGSINILARQLMQEALTRDKSRKSYATMTALLSMLLLTLAGYLYYENTPLRDAHVFSLKSAQGKPAEIHDADKLVTENDIRLIVKDDSSDQAQLSALHESLSLKLSDLLTGQSTREMESSVSP